MSKQLSLALREASAVFRPADQIDWPSRAVTAAPLDLECLNDHEVLSRILASVGAEVAASAVLYAFPTIAEAATSSRAEFVARTGIDHHVHDLLQLAHEIGARVSRSSFDRQALSSFTVVQDYLQVRMGHLPIEQFRVLFLDRKNHLIEDNPMWTGTVDHCPVYPREIIRRAIELGSNAIVVSHNHPSGDCTPSQADIKMTKQIIKAAAVFDIKVHDHIIVSRGTFCSFKVKGLI